MVNSYKNHIRERHFHVPFLQKDSSQEPQEMTKSWANLLPPCTLGTPLRNWQVSSAFYTIMSPTHKVQCKSNDITSWVIWTLPGWDIKYLGTSPVELEVSPVPANTMVSAPLILRHNESNGYVLVHNFTTYKQIHKFLHKAWLFSTNKI